MDLTPLTTPLIQTAGAIVAIAIPILCNRALSISEARAHFNLTAQQQATLTAAEGTAVGLIQAELAKGAVMLSDVSVSSPIVQKSVAYLDSTVPEALRAFGLTPQLVAQKIVGKLGVAIGADPTVPSVPAEVPPAPAATSTSSIVAAAATLNEAKAAIASLSPAATAVVGAPLTA